MAAAKKGIDGKSCHGGGAEPVYALDANYYTDPDVFERDKQQILFRTWQYAGHVSQVENEGDFFAFNLCDQNLFTVRAADGVIRSFFNVCMHRAHQLVEDSGNKRVLVCPYHSWTYNLDGRLRKAPNDEKVPGFDRENICLSEVRTELFCGFIFVNLDPRARPMAEWFPDVEEQLRSFVPHIDELKLTIWNSVEEHCNWKVTVENYSECYHCRINHPTFSSGVIDPDQYNIMAQGHCLRHTTGTAPTENMTYVIDNQDDGAHAAQYSSWFLWPAFSFQVYPGRLLNTYLWRPVNVTETLVYRGWYSVDGAPSETVSRLAAQDLSTTVAEDIRLVNSVQQGLGSRGYRPGPLVIDPDYGVNSEHSIRTIHEWVLAAHDRHD
jgi:phenylpropionate dioxygenase-like ring-hydroxylating dioxygenase large terminal subunit